MPDKTINVIDTDFGNHYENLIPEKWWIDRLDSETFALHFECSGFPFEFSFIDLDEVVDGENLAWFKSNYEAKKLKKAPTRNRKTK